MSNKTIGGQAKELVLLFYEKNELKFTNKDIMVSIKNAKRLLEAGYTYDEIKAIKLVGDYYYLYV